MLFQAIGEDSRTNAVVKCNAHLTKTENSKLDKLGLIVAVGTESADRRRKDTFARHRPDRALYLACKKNW